MNCYRCGQPGHSRSNCPQNQRARIEDPPSLPPWDKPVPPRRPPSEIADATAHADAIRQALGWRRGGEDRHTPDRRELALAQVAESRRAREAGGL